MYVYSIIYIWCSLSRAAAISHLAISTQRYSIVTPTFIKLSYPKISQSTSTSKEQNRTDILLQFLVTLHTYTTIYNFGDKRHP